MYRSGRFGTTIVALLALFLAAGCELSEGTGDAGDAGNNGDQAPQCVSDGFCDTSCATGTDPDCQTACACDDTANICNVNQANSTIECACDDDCAGAASACGSDGFCDSECPSGADPDCRDTSCDCDDEVDICESGREESDTECACDIDCDGSAEACQSDGYADPNCLARDPDYRDEVSDCDYFYDVCEADDDESTDVCSDDPDCEDGQQACGNDGHCDTFCDPANGSPPPEFDCKDPDCDVDDDGSCDRP